MHYFESIINREYLCNVSGQRSPVLQLLFLSYHWIRNVSCRYKNEIYDLLLQNVITVTQTSKVRKPTIYIHICHVLCNALV